MYTTKNYATKKALREAIAAGDCVTVFQPNNMFEVVVPKNGTVTIEGPHYPKPHSWYAQATLKDGVIVKVK